MSFSPTMTRAYTVANKSISEIIDIVGRKRFSDRLRFCEELNQLTIIEADKGAFPVKVVWPHALFILSIEDWNVAYLAVFTDG